MNTKTLTADTKDELKSSAPKPANIKLPDFTSAPVTDTLATLKVNPDTGLSRAEVDIRRKENGRLVCHLRFLGTSPQICS